MKKVIAITCFVFFASLLSTIYGQEIPKIFVGEWELVSVKIDGELTEPSKIHFVGFSGDGVFTKTSFEGDEEGRFNVQIRGARLNILKGDGWVDIGTIQVIEGQLHTYHTTSNSHSLNTTYRVPNRS